MKARLTETLKYGTDVLEVFLEGVTEYNDVVQVDQALRPLESSQNKVH